MRSKAIYMALLALAFQAQAVPVLQSDAESAARAWAQRGRHMGVALGRSVEDSVQLQTESGTTFYAVKMGGGTVFTSGDTEVEPIVAFTSEDINVAALDKASPLWALLNRDLSKRQPRSGRRLAFAAAPTVSAAKALSAAETKWQALIDADTRNSVRGSLLFAAARPLEPDDLRVPALMKTKWSQADGIWNYYTPGNAVCGCVATAAAQVMRYYHGTPDANGEGGLEIPFPVESVEQKEFDCQYRGKSIKLTLKGGTYAWDNMPFTADDVETDEQKQNIGKLTSDVGISVKMMYESGPLGSSAYFIDAVEALLSVFGYRQAAFCSSSEGLDVSSEGGLSFLGKTLMANFDARRPCLLGIPGHAIVADGYGFEDDVPYVHLNFGWAGQCDLWYNLPDMTEAGEEYNAIQTIGYNIFPEVGGVDEGSGQTTHAIVSGRVLDDDGLSVPDCPVALSCEGVEVTNLVTDAFGVWAAILPPGTYDVDADPGDGKWIGSADGVPLTAPETEAVGAVPVVMTPEGAGNSWGNDIQLQHPSVRINGDDSLIFSSVDRAIAKAREVAAGIPGEPVELEIIDQTVLKRDQVVDFPCVIVATNALAAVTPVERLRNASLVVTNAASLALTNVAFFGSTSALVKVRDGSQLRLEPGVDFGIGADAVAVETEGTDGFVLAARPSPALTLQCAVSKNLGEVFGVCDVSVFADAAAAAEAAQLIVNADDANREIRGAVGVDGTLSWQTVDCPLEDAAGYFVTDDGATTNCYARLDRAVEELEKALASGKEIGEFVVRKSDTLSKRLTVAQELTIRGEGNPEIDCAKTAGFDVKTGGSFALEGVSFSGIGFGEALFLVDGGELTLGAGVVLHDISNLTKSTYSGALYVKSGKATVQGASFVRCANLGQQAKGGAISVGDSAELVLNGGSISNCSAKVSGGGVYVGRKAKVTVGGALYVVDNVAGTSPVSADDIYVAYPKQVTFLLADNLESGLRDSIGVKFYDAMGSEPGVFGNDDGSPFISAEGVSEDAINAAITAFFNDVHPDYEVVAADDGSLRLAWKEPDVPDLSTEDLELAVARIERSGSSMDGKMYTRLADALEVLVADGNGAATITLLQDAAIDADFRVDFPLTICSEGTTPFVVSRSEESQFKVTGKTASLTLTNVVFNGQGAARLFAVSQGATLKLCPDTVIRGVTGSEARDSGAVAVWNGGVFEMEEGAEIVGCTNLYWAAGTENGYGGAVLLDHSTAYLRGGTIRDCVAGNAGGVFANNSSTLYLSGNLEIADNGNLAGAKDNVRVSENSELWVDGPLSGTVGYTECARRAGTDDNVFGFVNTKGLSTAEIADSARCFVHDVTGDYGQAVADKYDCLLVWGAAIENGKYKDYDYIDAGDPVMVPVPTAVEDLTYSGEEQVGVPEGVGYQIVGNRATNVGDYTATVTLRTGFAWATTQDASFELPWSIAKAAYDMSGVAYVTNFVWDGERKRASVTGLPAGVTARFGQENEIGWSDAGEYPVRVEFDADDPDNYEAIEGQDLLVVIEKAKYDISGVVFSDVETMYNGAEQSIYVDEASLLTLPEGVTFVGYEGNGQVTSGVYEVKALFVGDEKNHEKIEPLTATLTIIRNPDMPNERLPGPGPEPVQPEPIAIKSIEKVDETTWRLVVTDAVQWCNYAVFATNSLAGGFAVTNSAGELIVDPVTNFQWKLPDKEITLELQADGSQLFWKAEAKEGTAE